MKNPIEEISNLGTRYGLYKQKEEEKSQPELIFTSDDREELEEYLSVRLRMGTSLTKTKFFVKENELAENAPDESAKDLEQDQEVDGSEDSPEGPEKSE